MAHAKIAHLGPEFETITSSTYRSTSEKMTIKFELFRTPCVSKLLIDRALENAPDSVELLFPQRCRK